MPTILLPKLFDFPVKAIEVPPVIPSRFFFQANHYDLRRGGKVYGQLTCVSRCLLDSVVRMRALTCRSFCDDKNHLLSA